MAHLLKLDAQYQRHHEDPFIDRLRKWLHIVKPQMQQMCDNEQPFFRSYGCTSPHEFFAVSIEHFFESPDRFMELHPRLFHSMCILLNQNPLNTNGDYKYIPAPRKQQ